MDKRPHTLLITSTGLVGGTILSVLREQGSGAAQTYYPAADTPQGLPVDISDSDSVDALFGSVSPAVVILCAALTNVEFCQNNRDAAWKINVTGPQNVARACKKCGAKLVFFSSDYVFDGAAGPYSETDAPHPISVYGESKLAAESFVRGLDDHLIIRTTVVYGQEALGKNFCYRLINTLKAGQQIRVPKDQIGSPTYARNLAEITLDLVKKGRKGIYNVAGNDLADRFEFSRRVCAVFGLDEKLLVPVTTAELGQKAPRPLKAGLKTDKVSRDSAVAVMGIDESLLAFKKELYG
jgi:dTDP-4-dehydrorhamnose reductase